MNNVIRAWKDPAYRATLSAAAQAELGNPAGMIELTGTDLDRVAGGGGKSHSGKSSRSGKSKSGKSSRSRSRSKSGKSSRSAKSAKY